MSEEAITFNAKIWLWKGGKSAWHFVTLPSEAAAQVKFFVGEYKGKGWGAVPVKATIGDTSWQTSIFPEKDSNSYLLPLKAEIRKKEGLEVTKQVQITLLVNM